MGNGCASAQVSQGLQKAIVGIVESESDTRIGCGFVDKRVLRKEGTCSVGKLRQKSFCAERFLQKLREN